MNRDDFLQDLRERLVPNRYRTDLSDKVGSGHLLFKKGAYVFLAMPFSSVPPGDFGSATAKAMLRANQFCLPILAEKGLFLLYYGPEPSWKDTCGQFTVDKAALRPIILQSIHFVDPVTGANVNSRTHWGPIKFGFCGGVIADIESLCLTQFP